VNLCVCLGQGFCLHLGMSWCVGVGVFLCLCLDLGVCPSLCLCLSYYVFVFVSGPVDVSGTACVMFWVCMGSCLDVSYAVCVCLDFDLQTHIKPSSQGTRGYDNIWGTIKPYTSALYRYYHTFY
jgi:hypothetical protein